MNRWPAPAQAGRSTKDKMIKEPQTRLDAAKTAMCHAQHNASLFKGLRKVVIVLLILCLLRTIYTFPHRNGQLLFSSRTTCHILSAISAGPGQYGWFSGSSYAIIQIPVSIFCFCDLPIAFVADICLLPYDYFQGATKGFWIQVFDDDGNPVAKATLNVRSEYLERYHSCPR